jgi:glycosyltransferase involved in cell wall biosynthesis
MKPRCVRANFILRPERIAVVHDWLIQYAGAERVLEQILAEFPAADLYTLVDFLPSNERAFVRGRPVFTSFLQRMPGARRHYRQYLPLMPLAVEQFDLSRYDLVISSTHAVAKGVITGPDQLHVAYVYSPIRYAWDLHHQYLEEAGLDRGLRSAYARWVLHKIRLWDQRTANGVDAFIAISRYIAQRVHKVYRREATVIYPPVDVGGFTPGDRRDDFYVTVSRIVPYKKVGTIADAFAGMPEKRLVIIGDGPEAGRVRKRLTANVTMLGQQPETVLRDHLRRARAFVFAAEEDFGIAPLEAQACGTPVIAYAKGGVLETLRGQDDDNPTGVFFFEQTSQAIRDAVATFETVQHRIGQSACRENALRFGIPRFRGELRAFIDEQWEMFQRGDRPTAPRAAEVAL